MSSPIASDTKDWTWVLERRCPECGFDTTSIAGRQVPPLLRRTAAAWLDVLRSDSGLRARPAADRWSPLEYGCHVRDVLRLGERRVAMMQEDRDPTFPNWDQDRTAVVEAYDEQAPDVVAAGLQAAAESLAGRLEGLPADAWRRAGSRSDGARFTIETFARYVAHDAIHHLSDIGHLAAASG